MNFLNTWECDSDDYDIFLMTSQVAEKKVLEVKPQPSTRWGPPMSSNHLEQIRKDGIPKSTKPTGNYLCGLSDHLGGHKVLSRVMNTN